MYIYIYMYVYMSYDVYELIEVKKFEMYLQANYPIIF